MNSSGLYSYRGCLLGGAVGDALGWPVEFMALAEIRRKFGPAGMTALLEGEAGRFEISDDTQMTLFTAEGLLRGWAAARQGGGAPDFGAAVHCSYRSWLRTQGEGVPSPSPAAQGDGWLSTVEQLYRRRAPGNTCLDALRHGTVGTNGLANNSSKGCGGVMRAAPAGLLAARITSGDKRGTIRLAFELGCSCAALTHGHPSGYYPAGLLAAVIAAIVTGSTLEEGITLGLALLDGRIGSRETAAAVQGAVALWHDRGVTPSPAVIEALGGGWVGEEALAIGLYCALAGGEDFRTGVCLAVNHSGDSDSTGAICGNLLGVLLGDGAIPAEWLEGLELAAAIRQIGVDLFTAFEESPRWRSDYPPVKG